MREVEAALIIRSSEVGTVVLDATADPGAVRTLRDLLVDRAREEARRWRDRDPAVFAVKAADFEWLCKLLAWLIPDGERPPLRLVHPRRDRGEGEG